VKRCLILCERKARLRRALQRAQGKEIVMTSRTSLQASSNRQHQRTASEGRPRPQPFTADDYARRVNRGLDQAKAAGITGLIIAPGPDLQYFCGYVPTAITERPTLLVLSSEHASSMLVPLLEKRDAAEAAGTNQIELVTFSDGEDPYAIAADLLDGRGTFAVSDSCWSMHILGLQKEVPGVVFKSLTNALPMLRAVKGVDEVARLQAAAAAADACYPPIRQVRFAGRQEGEVSHDLADLLTANGHSQVDFTIVASGPNGANPHHLASERVIEEGDMVVLDYGGIMDGYGSDTTRTVHVGEPTPEERKVHEIVVRAQQIAFEAVKPGVACQEIDRAGRRVISEEGYGEYFIHRIGHGIGMTTHEPPYMVEGETRPIVAGMCFSIEPGIYLPGRFGVRIEDIVVATEEGGRRLNNNPHEMQIVS
jgi:Xaa-Pro aminopeptidase